MSDGETTARRAAEAYAAKVLSGPAIAAAVDDALRVAARSGSAPDREQLLAAIRDAAARRVPPPASDATALPRGLLRRLPSTSTCPLVPELLAARSAGRLSVTDIERLSRHLASCAWCRQQEAHVFAGERAFKAAFVERISEPASEPAAEPPAEPVLEPFLASAPAVAPSHDADVWRPAAAATAAAPAAPAAAAADSWAIDTTDAGLAAIPMAPAEWEIDTPPSAAGDDEDDFEPPADSGEWAELPVPATTAAVAPVIPRMPRSVGPLASGAIRFVAPAIVILAAAGGAMAASGVFDTGPPSARTTARSAPVTKAQPTASATTTPLAKTTNAERRAAQLRRERRQAAALARQRAEQRRSPAATTPVRVPARTTTPAPATPAPAAPKSSPPSTPTSTSTQTTPQDSTKSSPPSSEPGRQPPPSS